LIKHFTEKENPRISHFFDLLSEKIKISDEELVCFSCMGPEQFLSALGISESLKRKRSNLKIAFGGYEVSLIDKNILSMFLWVDCFFKGSFGKKSISAMKKIFFGEKVPKIIEDNSANCIDGLDFSGVFINNYSVEIEGKKEIIWPMMLTFGCPYGCRFCNYSPAKTFYSKSQNTALNVIKSEIKNYNAEYFFFVDSNFNFNKVHLLKLCKNLERLRIKWACRMRAESMHKKDFTLLKQAGCKMISWGIESGSQRLLDNMNKGISITEAENILRGSCEAGIKNRISLINGLPGESFMDFMLTLKFIVRNYDYIDWVGINNFVLFLDSPIYKNYFDFGIHPKKKTIEEEITRESRFKERNCPEFVCSLKTFLKFIILSAVIGIVFANKHFRHGDLLSVLKKRLLRNKAFATDAQVFNNF